MKLKNVQTGEIRDVVSISQDKDMITGLYFFRDSMGVNDHPELGPHGAFG